MARISLLNKWFKHFTDEGNPKTYMNRSGSAKAAGYKASSDASFRNIGYQNFTKLNKKIGVWMEKVGMSDNALHKKHLQLQAAKETKVIKVKGYVGQESLPPGFRAIGTSGLVTEGEDGEKEYSAGETLIEVETEALHIQRQILDMGYKLKGSYSPEKHDISGSIDCIKLEFVPSPNKQED